MPAKGAERPLVAKVILLTVFVLNEFLVLFVDGVVCEMHVLVILVNLGRVGLTGEPGKAFLENVNPQRLVTCYQNVNSQIELVTIDQKRICDISGND